MARTRKRLRTSKVHRKLSRATDLSIGHCVSEVFKIVSMLPSPLHDSYAAPLVLASKVKASFSKMQHSLVRAGGKAWKAGGNWTVAGHHH